MSTATQEVIDHVRIGTKGFPRHYAALGIDPPKKIVPVEDGRPQHQAPAMSLTEYAAAKRWEKEVGGIMVEGVPVATDDRSKIMISGARIKADKDAAFTTQWKGSEGFITLNAATIIAISDAVLDHVDACFTTEAAVLAQIEAGEITTAADIDAAFAA